MKSRLLSLVTLLALVIPLALQPMVTASELSLPASSSTGTTRTPATSSSPQPAGSPPVPSPDYSGIGAARQIKEVANRTDGGQSVTLFYNSTLSRPINGSTSVVLPPGWTGYKLGFSVTQLYENRCWVLNPSFNGNNNSWTTSYVDVRGYTNTFSQTWQSGGVDGNGYARVQENGYLTGGYYRYDLNDHVWERQIYTVNRSNVVWAGIRMDYRVDSAWGTNALFNVYIRINGTLVWVIGFQSVPDTNWHNTGFISINPGLFTLPSKAIQVEVGINSTMTVGYSTNSWMRGEFDNIRLYTKTAVYPSEIGLKMNGLTVPNQASRGSGVLTQVPATVWTSSPVIGRLNWSTIPRPPNPNLDVQVTGVCALNLFANKTGSSLYAMSPSATGVKYSTQSGQNTTWELYYQLALPSLYSNDVFNFTIPKDWNVTFVSEPQLPSVNKVSQCQGGHVGDGYLKVPSTTITVSPDGYWYIRASSHNYVYSAALQILQGTSWSTTTAVRAGNTTRVLARILDGSGKVPVGVTSTQANVSIYNPDGTTLWYTQLVAPNSSGWVVSSNIIIQGSTTIGGVYTISVRWSNSTEAGERQSTYSVTHATTLIPREPTIYAFYENQPLYPRARYNDTDSHVWLSPPATVTGNWTTGTITFNWIAGTGYYEAEINALDVPDVGRYAIHVTATKSYYDGASCYIIIDISAETQVACPQSPALSVAWSDNASIQVHYMRKTDGAGVNGCIPYVEVTANWTASFYSIVFGGNGWYTITLNSTAKALGTYALNITLTKERFERQQFYLYVTVRARNTQFTYTPPTSTPPDENATVTVQCLDLDAGGAALLNTTGRLHLQVWNSTIQWPSGSNYFWITSLGAGTYNIYINTSYLPGVGNYSFQIRFLWVGEPYHANRTISLTITVRQFLTRIDYDAVPQVPWDENANVTIYYLVDDTASTRHNGNPIGTGIITATLNGKPLVNGVNFTYTEVLTGEYRITIYKAVLGSVTSYMLHVSISYPSQPNPARNLYRSASRDITFGVRRLATQVTYDPPSPTPRGDNAVVVFYYRVNDPESSHNGQGITGVTSIAGTTLDGNPLTPGTDYTLADNGAGKYTLTLLFSGGKISSIKSYSLALHVVSPDANHDAADRTIPFSVRTLSTRISYTPLTPVPRGNNVTISFNYTVNDPASSQNGQGITGVTSIAGTTLDGSPLTPGTDYVLVDNGGGKYTLTIRYSSGKIGTVKSYSLALHVVNPDAYHDAADATIPFTVRRLQTSITYDAVAVTPRGENVTIVFYYMVNDAASSQNGQGIPGVTSIAGSTLDGSSLIVSDYSLVDNGAGRYTLTIRYSSGKISSIKSYSLALHVVSPDAYHDAADATIPFTVRRLQTTITYDAVALTPRGENVTIVFYYRVNDAASSQNGQGIPGVTSIAGSTLDGSPLVVSDYLLVDNGLGKYTLTIRYSSGKIGTVKSYTLALRVVSPDSYHDDANQSIGFSVRRLTTSVSYEVRATPWGENIIITFNYTVNDAASSQNGQGIPGVTSIAGSTLDGSPLTPGTDYTLVDNGAGKYTLTLLSSSGRIGTIKSYTLALHVVSPDSYHDAADRDFSLTVRRLRTRLDYTPPTPTPFGDDVRITLLYLVFDDESSRDGQGINDASASLIVHALGGWTLNPGDYSYVAQGAGYYLLTIKASALPSITTYRINGTIQEVSTGRYESASISRLDFIVRTVYTALTLNPFDPAAWGANVTIVAHYQVSDAGSSLNGNPVTGAPVDVVGIGWTLSHSDFTIIEPSAGTYYIEINTSAVAWPGSWQINVTVDWPASPPTYQERYYVTTLVVTTRSSTLTPAYVPSADYGAVFNVTLTYYDIVGAQNIANDTFGAHVRILVFNATDNSPMSLSVYTVSALPDHTYVVGIYTSTFGRVNVFHQFRFNATWAAGYLPFYANASASVTVYVVGTKTTVLYTPPEPEPYGDTLTFIITYNMTAAPYTPIDNTTGYVHMTAGCPAYPGLSLRYVVQMLASGTKGYLLVINSSNFPVLGQYTFQVNLTWPTNVAPYYESQTVLMSAYVRAIHTSMTWTLPDFLYWGDTLYLRVTYRDEDHGVVFSDPTNTTVTTWLSWSDWQVVQIFSNGTYQLRVNTTGRNVGLASFNIRFTRIFAETREQTVQFTINPLPLTIEVLSLSPWTAKFNESVVVTVRVTDIYGRRINDSTTVYHWAGLPPGSLIFMGNGVYNVTFPADQDVGTYIVTIEADKINCQTGLATMTLYIIPVDTSLVLLTTSIDAVVGETFRISARFTTISGTLLPGASLHYSWAGGQGTLVYVGDGVFNATLSSSSLALGRYSIYVTASNPNVVEKLGLITVTLTVIPASIQPAVSVLNVNWTQDIIVLVYFNDTYHNLPISGATINYRWGPLVGSLNATGTPGWYNGTLPSTIYPVGVYDLTLTVDQVGYQFATTTITVNIVPQPTELALQHVEVYYPFGDVTITLGGTTWRVPTGDILRLYFNFTDSRGRPITNATGRYYWELGDETLQFANGFYVASIDLNGTTPALYSLRVYFQRQNYATAQMTDLNLNVVLVDTEIRSDESLAVYTGTVFSVQVTFWDAYHDLPIVGANVTLAVPALGWAARTMRDNHDGTYTLDGLSVSVEGSFNMVINAAGAERYARAQRIIPLVVTLSPIVRTAVNIGAAVALIGFVAVAGWLLYAKVYSIPWLVRKMRGMSKTIGKGKTPSLSNRDLRRIATRPAQVTGIVEPVYDSAGLVVTPAIVPVVAAVEERGAEDETIWRDLEQLEGLGPDQKLELFEEMKRIPAKERVWFLEDLKRQLADGQRFGRARARPAEKRAVPSVPAGIDPGVMARLDAISTLSPEEKRAMIEQLKGLSKAEQEEAVRALEQAER